MGVLLLVTVAMAGSAHAMSQSPPASCGEALDDTCSFMQLKPKIAKMEKKKESTEDSWVLLLRQTTPTYKTRAEWLQSFGSIQDLDYSILSTLTDSSKGSDGKFHFKLVWQGVGANEWKQSSNPVNSAEPMSGYESIDTPFTGKHWGGLEYNWGKSVLDGSVGSGKWFYAVGSSEPWQDGIPGPEGSPVSAVELWVQAPTSATEAPPTEPTSATEAPTPTEAPAEAPTSLYDLTCDFEADNCGWTTQHWERKSNGDSDHIMSLPSAHGGTYYLSPTEVSQWWHHSLRSGLMSLSAPCYLTFYYHMNGSALQVWSWDQDGSTSPSSVWSPLPIWDQDGSTSHSYVWGNQGDSWHYAYVEVPQTTTVLYLVGGDAVSGYYTGEIHIDDITFGQATLVKSNTGCEYNRDTTIQIDLSSDPPTNPVECAAAVASRAECGINFYIFTLTKEEWPSWAHSCFCQAADTVCKEVSDPDIDLYKLT